MSSEKFCLKWNDFKSNVSESFRDLRDDLDFCDVTLVSEDNQQTKTHKVILAASSPFFMEMLRINKHSHPLIYMRGIKAKALTAILDFIYYGEANIYQEDLDNFLALAEELQLKGLVGEKVKNVENLQEKNTQIQKKEEQMFKDKEIRNKTEELAISHVGSDEDRTTRDFKSKIPSSLVSENQPSKPLVFLRSDLDNWNETLDSMVEKIDGVWTCTTCGKTSKKKGDAKRHTETHIEGISHPCNNCGKTFRSSNALRKYIVKVQS